MKSDVSRWSTGLGSVSVLTIRLDLTWLSSCAVLVPATSNRVVEIAASTLILARSMKSFRMIAGHLDSHMIVTMHHFLYYIKPFFQMIDRRSDSYDSWPALKPPRHTTCYMFCILGVLLLLRWHIECPITIRNHVCDEVPISLRSIRSKERRC